MYVECLDSTVEVLSSAFAHSLGRLDSRYCSVFQTTWLIGAANTDLSERSYLSNTSSSTGHPSLLPAFLPSKHLPSPIPRPPRAIRQRTSISCAQRILRAYDGPMPQSLRRLKLLDRSDASGSIPQSNESFASFSQDSHRLI